MKFLTKFFSLHASALEHLREPDVQQRVRDTVAAQRQPQGWLARTRAEKRIIVGNPHGQKVAFVEVFIDKLDRSPLSDEDAQSIAHLTVFGGRRSRLWNGLDPKIRGVLTSLHGRFKFTLCGGAPALAEQAGLDHDQCRQLQGIVLAGQKLEGCLL